MYMLPSVQDLFADSWQVFKKSIVNIFLFYLIGVGIFLAVAIIGAILLGITGAGAALFSQTPGSATAFFQNPASILFIILAIILVIVLITASFILQIGPILIVDNPEKSVDFKAILQKSLHLAWPLFLTQLLVGLIVFGGLILLIIPGIIISIFLSFALYEVILEKKCCLEALRESVRVVSKNFWGILGRLFIFFAVSILAAIALKDSSGLYFVFNLLWGWFGIAYSITLYKQAKKLVHSDDKGDLKWIVIISLIGWIITVLAFSALVRLSSGVIQNITKNSDKFPTLQELQELESGSPSSQLQED